MSVALFLAALLSTLHLANGLTVTTATLLVNDDTETVTLTLNFDGIANGGAFNAANVSLQEGFFDHVALEHNTVTYPTTSSIELDLEYATHRVNNQPLDYAVSVGVDAIVGVVVTPADVTPAVSYAGTPPTTIVLPENMCNTLDGELFQSAIIDSLEKLKQIGGRKCTVWPGGLVLRGLTLTSAQFYAGLSTVQEIEGFLVIEDCVNLHLGHFSRLNRIASGNPPILYQDGISFRAANNVGFDMSQSVGLKAFLEYVRDGKSEIVDNTPGICFDSADLVPRWWGEKEFVFIREDLALCAECNMHTSGTDCVSWCSECPQTCSGGTIYGVTELARYTGRNCSFISGFLSISDLADISEDELEVFADVTVVEGMVSIVDNQFLTGLDFLRNMESASFILIDNNHALTDARLPALNSGVQISIGKNNRRLCEGAYPYNSTACGFVEIFQSLTFNNFDGEDFDTDGVLSEFISTLNAVGVPISNFSISAEVSGNTVIATVVAEINIDNSFEMLTQMKEIVDDGTFATALGIFHSNYTSVNVTTTFPKRFPPRGAGYDRGITLGSSLNLNEVALNWNDPILSVADGNLPKGYFVQYTQKADQGLIEDLAEFFLAEQLVVGDKQTRLRKAEDAFEVLFDWTIIDKGSLNSHTISSCAPDLEKGFFESVDCLVPDNTYKVQIKNNVGTDVYLSDVVETSLVDSSMVVKNLNTTSSNLVLSATWDEPEKDPAIENTIIGYRVQVRYHTRGNALWDEAGKYDVGKEIQFSNELLTETNERVLLSKNVTSWSEDCFNDFQQGVPYCILPWTMYRVTVRAIGSIFNGATTSTYVSSGEGAPDSEPRDVVSTDITGTKVTLSALIPSIPNGVITKYIVRFYGDDDETDADDGIVEVTMAYSGELQVTQPDLAHLIEVVGLSAYTNYTLSVCAATAIGEGPATNLTVTTAETEPSRPTRPIVTASGADFNVIWSKPEPANGEILYYVLWGDYDEEIVDSGILLENTTELSATISSVGTKGVRVRAYTAAGGSEFSEAAFVTSTSSSAGESSGSNSVLAGVAAGVVAFVVLMVGIIVIRRRQKNLGYMPKDHYEPPEADRWEYERKKLKMGRKLGQGAFGVVCEAVAQGIQEFNCEVKVAVKQCAGENITSSDKKEFIAEALLMKKFADPWDKNVIRLLGVCTQSTTEPILIITELCEKGDLKELLRSSRPSEGQDALLSIKELISMSVDIASGMAFLASKQFVHRDLACRNCLVTKDMIVKIADFGMSRDVHYSQYYRKNGEALMPVRWMAPKSLMEGVFTTDTDIWSFGVVLWEVITYAKLPYPGLSNQEVFDKVTAGYRMSKPDECPCALFDIMESCWQSEGLPQFLDLKMSLEDILTRLAKGFNDADLQATPGFMRNPSRYNEAVKQVDLTANEEYTPWENDSLYPPAVPGGMRSNSPALSSASGYTAMSLSSAQTGTNDVGMDIPLQPNSDYVPIEMQVQDAKLLKGQEYVPMELNKETPAAESNDYVPIEMQKKNATSVATTLEYQPIDYDDKKTDTNNNPSNTSHAYKNITPGGESIAALEQQQTQQDPKLEGMDYIPLELQQKSQKSYKVMEFGVGSDITKVNMGASGDVRTLNGAEGEYLMTPKGKTWVRAGMYEKVQFDTTYTQEVIKESDVCDVSKKLNEIPEDAQLYINVGAPNAYKKVSRGNAEQHENIYIRKNNLSFSV